VGKSLFFGERLFLGDSSVTVDFGKFRLGIAVGLSRFRLVFIPIPYFLMEPLQPN